jgi:hypothetical protein
MTGLELGVLRPLQGPVAEQLLPSSFAQQERDAGPFLLFALEELRASRTVNVVATPQKLVTRDQQATWVFDPACELGPTTSISGFGVAPCVARKRDRFWPYAPLHLAVAARAIEPAKAVVSLSVISAGARGPTQPIELEVSRGIPNLLWMPESSTKASDVEVALATTSMRGVLVIVTAWSIESKDDLRQIYDRQQSDNWARAARRLSAPGLATLSSLLAKRDDKWQAQRKRAVAGEMSFVCRRGPLHDSFHRVPRRVKAGTPAFPGLLAYCSSGLPWEGAALGLYGPVWTCKDGEQIEIPKPPRSDDAPCLGRRPDGSLYPTTFGAARATQGVR